MISCKLRHSNGSIVDLVDYHNQVLLIVNVASLCEHTHQYAQLSQLMVALKDQPFNILAFPCNQFADQEPAPIAEILNFCINKFNINFQLFDKVEVNGENAHPLFKFLTENTPCSFKTNTVKWNFTKFLVTKNLKPVRRYNPSDLPISLLDDIKTLL